MMYFIHEMLLTAAIIRESLSSQLYIFSNMALVLSLPYSPPHS